MLVIRHVAELQQLADRERSLGRSIGLVPTMGALHAGHLSLVEEARRRADRVWLSIFVNPTQFDDADDMDAYPSTFEADLRACRDAGVDVVFAPGPDEMYDPNSQTWVDVDEITRPGPGAVLRGGFFAWGTVFIWCLPPNSENCSSFGTEKLGGSAGDPEVRPQAHIFVGSKAPWYEITDALECFEAYPPGIDATEIERETRTAETPGAVGGSCLCGAVAFEFEGTPLRMVNCHCSRCRRARSAAHASNLFIDAAGFRWLRGEERVKAYKLPAAARFAVAFCEICGSELPRVIPGAERINIPAGSLDDDPGVTPTLHIHVGSKAPWFEISDQLPAYDEGVA